MKDFASFNLPDTILTALGKIGFKEPTPIQAQAVPLALKGMDVLGTAATGTGKTAAFALPMLAHLIRSPRSAALIMTPTRELAVQVLSTIQPLLLLHRDLHTACLIGGEAINKQFAQLNRRPRLIVGTPGRINDHLVRGSLRLENADFLVLDETDRMLDMGFGVQIETIIAKMAKTRQTLMFSATLPKEILSMAARYLKNPQRVSVGVTNKPAAKIKEELVETTDGEKYEELLRQLVARDGSIIVFVKTRHGADRLATRLCKAEHKAEAIHGDLQQRKRDRVIQSFRDKKHRILVATDVAARGLDIPHIEHVINYDLPQAPEDYIHRIGRTARAGASGEAVNLVTPSEKGKWRAIVKLMHPEEEKAGRGERDGERRFSGERKSGPRRGGGKGRKGDAPAKQSFGRSFGEKKKKQWGDRFEEPRSEGFRSEGFRSEKPRSEKSRSGGFRSERADGFRSERPRSENSRSEGFRSEKPRSGGFRSERADGFRSERPKSDGSRYAKGKPANDRARGARSGSSRPANDGSRRPQRSGGRTSQGARRPSSRY